MDQVTARMAEGLKQAIQSEGDGYHFYTLAAQNTADEQGRRVFEQLAREELDHLRFLRAHYTAILETGQLSPDAKLGPKADLSATSPIYSAAIRERLGEAHAEMSALSIGIQLEQSAARFYREMAEEAQDPQVAGFFNELADWESGHYHALLRQQDLLRDDYWSTGGFSPF